MSGIVAHFKTHPWQRRMVTVASALIVGVAASLLAAPFVRDARLVRDLGSPDPVVRKAAILAGTKLAAQSSRTLGRLERALDGADDRTFSGIAAVLARINRFDESQRSPLQIDRMRMIDLATTESNFDPAGAADTRRMILGDVILGGRDNVYTRRALLAASDDAWPEVREMAVLLAARLRDGNCLARLLHDPNGLVASASALAIGVIGPDAYRMPEIRRKESLRGEDYYSAGNTELASAIAYALASIDPNQYSGLIFWAASSFISLENALENSDYGQGTRAEAMKGRLAYVLSLLTEGNDLRYMPSFPLEKPDSLSAERLTVLSRFKHPSAGPIARNILRQAAEPSNTLAAAQVLAAMKTAKEANMPVRAEVNELCRRLWRPGLEDVLIEAATLLGLQATLQQPDDANAPSPEQCAETLRLAATYSRLVPPDSNEGPPTEVTTPIPSAAAAAALWNLQPSTSFMTELGESDGNAAQSVPSPGPSGHPLPQGERGLGTRPLADRGNGPQAFTVLHFDSNSSAFYVHEAAGQSALAADYIAWHLTANKATRHQAFELGLTFLPALMEGNTPPEGRGRREYNENVRAAGAMLLALAASDANERQLAISRLRSRLAGGVIGREPGIKDKSAYQCGLLILGQRDLLGEVRGLLDIPEVPLRRAATALLLAGDGQFLDWLLEDWQQTPEGLAGLIAGQGLGEVLAAFVPSLPPFDPCGLEDLGSWQARIMHYYYVIHREEIQSSLRPDNR